jgi:hypothetical protein
MSRGWIEDRSGRRGLRWRARHGGSDGQLRSRSFERRTDAQAWLDGQRAQIMSGQWVDPEGGRLTLTAWFEVWLGSKQRITARTRYDYEGILRSRISASFGVVPLVAIDRARVADWVEGMVNAGLSPS